jgi:hypothetical protein
MVVPGAKEPIMTAMAQTEKADVRELSLEEMEQVSGGEFMNPSDWIAGCIVRMVVAAGGGLQISTAPLR